MSGSKPKKRFSQNFLADKNIAAKIVNSLEIDKADTVFEIGSGRGTLTELIADQAKMVYSFEIDRQLIDPLLKKFKNNDNVEIVNTDFLKINPDTFHSGKIKLIGNIPYDITSPLLDWMVRYRENMVLSVITVQKEMADRLGSSFGNKNWAPISIFIQCSFEIRKLFVIPPDAFYPPPKVNSAVISLSPRDKYRIENRTLFEDIVRLAFKYRRKYLINNLAEYPGLNKEQVESILEKIGLDKKVRAEQLSIENYINLTKAILKLTQNA